MAIFQDSVLVGGLIFFLSTYSLWFSMKKISNSQFESKKVSPTSHIRNFLINLIPNALVPKVILAGTDYLDLVK